METRCDRDGSGSQTITDLSGPVDVSTGSGSLALRGIRSDVQASIGSGGIESQDVGNFIGHAGSGRITASGVRGAVQARAGSGHIDIAQAGEGDVDVQTGSGGIEIAARAGRFAPAPAAAQSRPRGAPLGAGTSRPGQEGSRSTCPRTQPSAWMSAPGPADQHDASGSGGHIDVADAVERHGTRRWRPGRSLDRLRFSANRIG